MSNYYKFFLLVLLLNIPKFIKLLGHENYFRGDAAFYFLQARSLIVDHSFFLVGQAVGKVGAVGDFMHGAGWYYIFLVPFQLFGGDPFAGKFFMFCVSFAIGLYGYTVLKSYFGNKAGLFGLVFFSVSPYLISSVNNLLSPYVVPLIMIFYLHYFLKYLRSKKTWCLYIMAAALGSIIHFDIACFGFIFPSFVFLIAYLFFKREITFLPIIKVVLTISFFFLPHLIYDILNSFPNFHGLLNSFVKNSGTKMEYDIKFILENRYELFKANQYNTFPSLTRSEMIPLLLFLCYGSLLMLRDRNLDKRKRKFILFIISTIFSTWIVIIVFPTRLASFWWITALIPFNIFWAAIVFSYCLENKHAINKLLTVLLLFVAFNSFSHQFIEQLKTEKLLINIRYPISSQEPIEYIYHDSRDSEFKILYASGLSLEYQYLLWYVGKSKYQNSLGFKNLDLRHIHKDQTYRHINREKQFEAFKKGIYYVLIDDGNNKEHHYYSRRAIESIGKLVWSKRFSNGDFLEKRVVE